MDAAAFEVLRRRVPRGRSTLATSGWVSSRRCWTLRAISWAPVDRQFRVDLEVEVDLVTSPHPPHAKIVVGQRDRDRKDVLAEVLHDLVRGARRRSRSAVAALRNFAGFQQECSQPSTRVNAPSKKAQSGPPIRPPRGPPPPPRRKGCPTGGARRWPSGGPSAAAARRARVHQNKASSPRARPAPPPPPRPRAPPPPTGVKSSTEESPPPQSGEKRPKHAGDE